MLGLVRAKCHRGFSTASAVAQKYNSFQALKCRKLVAQSTDETRLSGALQSSSLKIYTGFDPTAKSLHVGNLLTVIALVHFLLGGHRVIALVGGATGAIGDPSGKSTDRVALDSRIVAANSQAIQTQLLSLFRNAAGYLERRKLHIDPSCVQTLDNLDWVQGMGILEFLGTVGRRARVSAMLARDSVKGRMEGEGISFAEFTYQLLQAYDFMYLNKHHDCAIQLGGSDQWGNIVAGLDLIKKSRAETDDADVFGLTIPLVTTASGEKFGKSEGNAVWLD
ncbi:tyrosyl-tRNA synthetase, partial [Kappamyces sp. JEL0680]